MSLEIPLGDEVFVTMDEFETYLHRDLDPTGTNPSTGEPFDTEVDEDSAAFALTAACQVVLGYVGDVRFLVDDEILVDGPGSDSVVLPHMPVWRVNTIWIDDIEQIPDTDWLLAEGTGVVVRRSWPWPYGRARIRINYDHGWVFPAESEDTDASLGEPVPEDMKWVAMGLASRILGAANLVNVGVGTATGSSADADIPANVVQYITEGATFRFENTAFTVKLTGLERSALSKYRAKGGQPYYRVESTVS